jgi:hypothetical protein
MNKRDEYFHLCGAHNVPRRLALDMFFTLLAAKSNPKLYEHVEDKLCAYSLTVTDEGNVVSMTNSNKKESI